jgi:heme oxygenase
MSLKDITKDLHTAAEKTVFAKKLVTGQTTQHEYATYLYNMLAIYDPIEFYCKHQGVLTNLKGIERLRGIYADFLELEEAGTEYYLTPGTMDYHDYLIRLGNDVNRKHLIKAHMYVRHMGDLFGGQYIAKVVPGSGKFYQFESPEELKAAIRAELTDDLGDEARVAFEWAIKIMRELGNE